MKKTYNNDNNTMIMITILFVGLLLGGIFGGLIGYMVSPEKVVTITEIVPGPEKTIYIIDSTNKTTNEDDTNVTLGDTLNGYILEDLYLDEIFSELTLSDRDISKLFDGEVEFDGKDYDAEELIILNNINLDTNNDDMEGNVYLTLKEGSISYLYTFDSLDVSEIGGEDEEYLIFNLLGQEVKVSSWDDDSIVFSQGSEYFMTEGDSITIGENVITLKYVMGGNTDSVYVEVDGIGKEIYEDDVKTVNGIEIRVNMVLASDYKLGMAELLIGDEVEIEAVDGDEYAEDSPFKWIVDGDTATIGVILSEDFDELDEDFNALSVGKKLCLPNDFVCLTYKGAKEEDSEKYTIKGDDEETEIYGKFIINDRESCDDILIRYNVSGDNNYTLWDEDNSYEDDDDAQIFGAIELEDSEYTLSVDNNTGVITFVNADAAYNIVIPFEVSSITVDGISLDKDYDYLTNYGVVVSNTEDIDEDLEVALTIPEEQREFTGILA